MSTEIVMIKVLRKDINYNTVMIPFDEEDIKKFKALKLGKPEKFLIRPDRQYSTHKHLFNMIKCARHNGISRKNCDVINESGERIYVLQTDVITAKIMESGQDEVRAWLDILEILFLPMVERTRLDGTKYKTKGSIQYSKLDEIGMRAFEDRVAIFFSDNLGMEKERFILLSSK